MLTPLELPLALRCAVAFPYNSPVREAPSRETHGRRPGKRTGASNRHVVSSIWFHPRRSRQSGRVITPAANIPPSIRRAARNQGGNGSSLRLVTPGSDYSLYNCLCLFSSVLFGLKRSVVSLGPGRFVVLCLVPGYLLSSKDLFCPS